MFVRDYLLHLIKSFGLHTLFIIGLIVSMDFTATPEKTEQEPEVSVIDAVVIDESALTQQIQKIKQEQVNKQAAEEKRVKDLEARAKQAQKQLEKINQDKKSSEKAAAKAKEKAQLEKKKAQQATKERLKREKEAAIAKKQAENIKRKKEAEQKALEKAQKEQKAAQALKEKREREEKQAAERKKKELERQAELAKQKQLQEKLLQEQLAQEQSARRKARQKVVMTEVNKFKALITAKIQQNLIVDEAMKGKSCRLNIKLAFSGLVTKVTKLSGEPAICRAAENAVLKAETLPVSKEQDVYQQLRNINLTVEPEF